MILFKQSNIIKSRIWNTCQSQYTGLELPPIRHKLLVQLSWSDRLKTEDIIKLLETYAKQIQNRLDIYNSTQQTSIAELGRTKRERLLWRALQDNGITAYNAELDWVRRTIEKLKKHELM